MRTWMVDPKIMCKNHLLGEHRELHALVGIFRLKKSINKFIEYDLVEPSSIQQRHTELVEEMENRGYNHRSELVLWGSYLDYLPKAQKEHKVDKEKQLDELLSRCPACRVRSENKIP